jgi:hypothetical protein
LKQRHYGSFFAGSVNTEIVFGWGASMSEAEVKISSERIDDIPLIVEWLKKIEIAKYIDQKLKKPHGNYEGMSYGQLSVLLLTYIITQSDHRLCAVEAWVEAHRQILKLTTGWSIGEKDATDDRLARVVEELGKQSIDICLPQQGSTESVVGKGFEVEFGKFWFNPQIKPSTPCNRHLCSTANFFNLGKND